MKKNWLRAWLPRTLFSRALLILLVPVLLAQLAATYVFFKRHWQNVTHRLTYAVAGDVGFLVEMIHDGGLSDDMVMQAARHLDLELKFSPQGKIPSLKRPWLAPLQQALEHALHDRLTYPFAVDRKLSDNFFAIYVQLPDGVLKIISPERRIYTPTTEVFIFIMIGSAIFFTAISVVFMRNQVRPIRRLAQAATAFGKGLDLPGFKPEGALEVRQAAKALLIMRERLRRQISQRMEMLSGVSHDLRTPLTRMKLELALLPASPEIDGLKKDVAEMTAMLEAYLAFARGEGAETAIQTDLTALVADVVAQAQRQHATLIWEGFESVWLSLRPQALRRCLNNLISNATRFGKNIHVHMALNDQQVMVMVDDDGPGIPLHQRDEVFRPFTRLDTARTATSSSVGLGLTIARDIARAQGGDVLLHNSPTGGLRAVIQLPR
ncbi:MAG: HAMP domain-containing protein [Alphaproteobacteria bacterium]|nr:HAMP domain-containing protein [Alphaproteobacteria bacterium]